MWEEPKRKPAPVRDPIGTVARYGVLRHTPPQAMPKVWAGPTAQYLDGLFSLDGNVFLYLSSNLRVRVFFVPRLLTG